MADEQVCGVCKNTNGEHKLGCLHYRPSSDDIDKPKEDGNSKPLEECTKEELIARFHEAN